MEVVLESYLNVAPERVGSRLSLFLPRNAFRCGLPNTDLLRLIAGDMSGASEVGRLGVGFCCLEAS